MRITGGRARGIRIQTPKGGQTRPATDRTREAVFSSPETSIVGCKVADLFAGSGSYGLEALSRGAAEVGFFEINRRALRCIRANVRSVLRSCGSEAALVRVIDRNVLNLETDGFAYDRIFLDPPYEMIESGLNTIFQKGVNPIALEGARAILELPGHLEPDIEGWELLRRIGKTGKNKPGVAILRRD